MSHDALDPDQRRAHDALSARRGGTYALWRPTKALLKDATAAEWHRVAHLDGAQMIGKAEVLAAIGRSLRFPAHYGKNLDALADCLVDLPESTVLIWSGWQQFALNSPVDFARIVGVLDERTTLDPTFALVLAGHPLSGSAWGW